MLNALDNYERKKKMSKEEIVKELREILKVYHYESDKLSVELLNNQHMSKDVATRLENIIISLTS